MAVIFRPPDAIILISFMAHGNGKPKAVDSKPVASENEWHRLQFPVKQHSITERTSLPVKSVSLSTQFFSWFIDSYLVLYVCTNMFETQKFDNKSATFCEKYTNYKWSIHCATKVSSGHANDAQVFPMRVNGSRALPPVVGRQQTKNSILKHHMGQLQ